MRQCPKLTCLDVRGNEAIGEEGVRALRMALREGTEKDGRPRSLCGLASNPNPDPDPDPDPDPNPSPDQESGSAACRRRRRRRAGS